MAETPLGVQADESGDELTPEQRKSAVSLILGFCALNQVCRLYDINNAIVAKVLHDMEAQVRTLTGSGEPHVSLTAAGHSFFLNRHLIRIGFSEYKKAQTLKQIFQKIGVGEVTFPADTTFEGLEEFAGKFVSALKNPDDVPVLLSQAWGGIRARAVLGGDSEEEAESKSYELAVRVYCGLLMLVEQTLVQVKKDDWSTLLGIKRTLQVMVENLENDQPLLLALTRSPVVPPTLATHLVNTALLTLALGRRLGLSRRDLVGLATAALFHDLPKAGLNDRTLNGMENAAALSEKDRARIGLHWLNQLRVMVRGGGFKEEALARLVVAYEAQLEFACNDLYVAQGGAGGAGGEDSAGDEATGEPTFFSRLVALCDRYETALWKRPGKRTPTPHEAVLAVLARDSGAVADPGLKAVFLRTVGLYPTGTLVQLNTGEMAVVVEQPPEGGDLREPALAVVVDRKGRPVEGARFELSGDPNKRRIIRPMPADALGINPAALILHARERAQAEAEALGEGEDLEAEI